MSDRTQQIIEKFDKALSGAEDRVIERINKALEAAYKRLEEKLLKAYAKYSDASNLLPAQRRLLILNEVNTLLQLLNPKEAEQLQNELDNFLRGNYDTAGKLSDELSRAIANEPLKTFAAVPLEAVRFQAEDGIRRLSRHSSTFANRVSATVEMGLVQGLGPRKIASQLRADLGILKGQAEMIARTESLSSNNQAIAANLTRNGFDAFLFHATADDRLCPYCSARNQKAYKLGESQPPLHPRCRCIVCPFKPSWVELGLMDTGWSQNFREEAIAEVKAKGMQLNNGLAPFEKSNGLKKPPEPIWEPI